MSAPNPSTSAAVAPAVAPAVARNQDGRLSKTTAYYIGFIALGLAGASLGPTLPGLAQHTGATLGQISTIFTGRSLGYFLGSLLSGRLYDRYLGHRLMAVGLVSMAALLALTPITPLLLVLTAILFVLGFAESLLEVGTNTLIVWVHREKVGPYMNGLHFFFGLGAFLSPLIVGLLLQQSGDITLAYWVLAALMIPAALNVLRLPSPSYQALPRRVDAHTERTNRILVALIMAFFFLYVGSEVGYGGWVFTFARFNSLATDQAAYLNSAYWGAFTLGRLLSIPIATRYSARAILSVDLVGALLSSAVMLVWRESTVSLWIGTLGLGLSIASVFPTMLTFAGTRMAMTGRVNGLFIAASSAGGMTLPWLMGQLIEPVGPYAVVAAVFISLALSALVFVALDRYSRRAAHV